ncbi:acyl-coenzyme A thioesterase 9, mitochondrial-like isoform X2 [Periplaneta americana]|uniref:acyl-coenzyme A thioesterase 9, mitochondrial-like isoform X2 n=1 Tax=Periplaneta americana TaxID=6978 RepID=UPI0037E7A3A1
MGIDRGYSTEHKSREHLLPLLPKSQDELPVRTMKDSFSMAVIPLSRDASLQEKYVSVFGSVRYGRLLEALDMFAVWVAHRHISNPKRKPDDDTPYVIVTVLVDQIDFVPLSSQVIDDIYLSGHVSWVGKSSMEVSVWVEQVIANKLKKVMNASFLMAARNTTLTHSAFVNPLVAENDTEAAIIKGGESRRNRRLHFQTHSLLKVTPDEEEMILIHKLFLSTIDAKDPTCHRRILPSNTIWMDQVQRYNLFNGYPEDRNMHNKVFGGFIMRQALSLSHHTATLYSQEYAQLIHMSDILFKNSINIGDIIGMQARVLYTEMNYMQVGVYADAYVSLKRPPKHTNSFQFTYMFSNVVKPVIPRTYDDAIRYIEGRRYFQYVMGLKDKQSEDSK